MAGERKDGLMYFPNSLKRSESKLLRPRFELGLLIPFPTNSKQSETWLKKQPEKKRSAHLKHPSIENTKITTKMTITDLLLETFTKKFFRLGQRKVPESQIGHRKLRKLDFASRNSKDSNKQFTLTELVHSINKSARTKFTRSFLNNHHMNLSGAF